MGLLCSSAFLILSFSLSNKDFPFLFFFSLFRFHFLLFFSLFRFLFFIFSLSFVFTCCCFFSVSFPLFYFFLSVSFSLCYLACKHGSGVHRLMSVAHHYVERCPPPAARAHAQEEGREGGGWWGFQRCKCHVWSLSDALVSIYLSECSTFSQTLLVNINEGQASSKWIVTIPSLANSWKPLKTFASAAKTPGPAPAIVGVLGTAPHISLKQLWLIWPSEKPKPSKDMICLLSSLYFLKIFIVIANLIVISGVSVSIEWQSDLSSHIFSPEDPTLGKG